MAPCPSDELPTIENIRAFVKANALRSDPERFFKWVRSTGYSGDWKRVITENDHRSYPPKKFMSAADYEAQPPMWTAEKLEEALKRMEEFI